MVPLFAAIPVRGAADTKEGGTGSEGEGSGGGEQGWHRPWESRARVAMTTAGSEAAQSGGVVGWGLAEGSKLGTASWVGSVIAPHLSSVFLENIQAHTHPSSQHSPVALQPHSRCAAGGCPSPPAELWQLLVLHTRADGRSHGTHLLAAPGITLSNLHPDLPNLFCHRQPPVYTAASCRISTCSRSRSTPDPYTPPPLPLDPTLTHTDADQGIHDGSEGLHILTLSHGPTMPARPRCPVPVAAANPGLNAGDGWGFGEG